MDETFEPCPLPEGVTYEWYADGELIPGETGPTYTIRPEDVNKLIDRKMIWSKIPETLD